MLLERQCRCSGMSRIRLEVLRDFAHETLERELADQEFRRLLVLAASSKRAIHHSLVSHSSLSPLSCTPQQISLILGLTRASRLDTHPESHEARRYPGSICAASSRLRTRAQNCLASVFVLHLARVDPHRADSSDRCSPAPARRIESQILRRLASRTSGRRRGFPRPPWWPTACAAPSHRWIYAPFASYAPCRRGRRRDARASDGIELERSGSVDVESLDVES